MYGAIFAGNKKVVLLRSAILIALIAVLDWRIVGEIPLGILYLFPMAMLGAALGPAPLALAAGLCTWLAEIFDDLAWNFRDGVVRDVLYFVAFFGVGLFVREVTRSRQTFAQHTAEIERQSEARRAAEEQLRVLIETSPAAVLLADANGTILLANEAAHRMLGLGFGELPGKEIHRYVPSLRNLSSSGRARQTFRTVMQARGRREDGETFLADISFSTYQTEAGLRLAAMVIDTSEELRSHEVSGLHQLLSGSRIAIGALSHEIRNLCAAISAVRQNLAQNECLTGNRDFDALGNLIDGLERIAKLNLKKSDTDPAELDLESLLDELRIVISPSLQEEGIGCRWECEPGLPYVWADRSSLMQVFLNLLTNSIRVLSRREDPLLSIVAKQAGDQVRVEVSDNGGGVAHPDQLFRPFQEGAESTGLGLYLSRAFLLSFGGELRYAAVPGGACFVVTLEASGATERLLT
ncbi:MAG: ATP-binding protein [Acidobacteriota bacterium]